LTTLQNCIIQIDMSNQTGAALLAAAIDSMGLGVREAARIASVDCGAMSRWIRGQRGPSVSAACRLRDAFGVPVDAWRDDEREAGTSFRARLKVRRERV
jgi:transcriptional regulator with XRE-family HTH domain